MKVRYENHQDQFDPLEGVIFDEREKLLELLTRRRKKPPFLACLAGENGFELMVGIGEKVGCVQHSRSNGDLPCLLAMSPNPPLKSGGIEFLTANTPTPVCARHIIRFDEVKEVAGHFLQTGERSETVGWEPVGVVKPDPLGPWRPRPHQIVLRFLLERWHNPRDDINVKIAASIATKPDWRSGQAVELCYLNHQDTHDPVNGSRLERREQLSELLEERRKYPPFVAQFLGDHGLKLVLGIGSGVGFVQFRRINGDLPYYMARPVQRRVRSRDVAFRVDNVPVPIPGRYILNFDEVERICQYFLATGERDPSFSWAPI